MCYLLTIVYVVVVSGAHEIVCFKEVFVIICASLSAYKYVPVQRSRFICVFTTFDQKYGNYLSTTSSLSGFRL